MTSYEMTCFGTDDRPEWICKFVGNSIFASCHAYANWKEVRPIAKERMDLLPGFIDPYKPVISVEYGVTDTFNAHGNQNAQIAAIMFQNNHCLSRHILDLNDPGWDFSQGCF